MCSTELEEASRDSFVVQDLDVDTLRLMLDYLYLGNVLFVNYEGIYHNDNFDMTVCHLDFYLILLSRKDPRHCGGARSRPGSTVDERGRLLCGAWPQKAL